MQDSTRHFTLHSVVENDADMAPMFERAVAMPVTYEMLYVGAWKQNLLLADRYQRGPRVSCRRCRASCDSDRRAWHEYRRRRRHRSVLEARGDAARLGRAEAARSYESSAGRSASAMSRPPRFAARGRTNGARIWRPNIRDNTPEGAQRAPISLRVADVEQSKANR